MENYLLNWSHCLFCFLLLVGFYFLLLLLVGLNNRAYFLREWQTRIHRFLQILLQVYEPFALVLIMVVFVLVNPLVHGPIVAFFILLGYQPIRNYISGRIFLLANEIKIGQRIEIQGNTGIVQKMERLGFLLQTPEGLRFVNYSSLLSDGFVLLKGEKIGGLHQLQLSPVGEEKKNHESFINNRLFSCPYVDWTYKPEIVKRKENQNQYSVRVLVREDQHLGHLVRLIKEWGYECVLPEQHH